MAEHVTISDYTPRESFTVGGTPSAGPFVLPSGFVVFDPSTDIKVYDDGVLLSYNASATLATEWSFSGTLIDGGYQGGNVTLGANITSSTVVIVRDIPIARSTDFPYPSESLDIEGLNTQIDMLFAIFQDREGREARALRQPDSDTANIDTIPAASSRASKYLGFDSDGDPVALDAPADTTAVSTYMATLLVAANEAALKALMNAEAGTDFAAATLTLTAGAGLTGGGTLASDRTFAVGAGTGIVANADDVAVDKATQANMEAATSNKVVTADVQHYHRSAAKVWGYVTVATGTPTLQESYNVTSITDSGPGDLTVTIATDFSNTTYSAACLVGGLESARLSSWEVTASRAVGSVVFNSGDSSGDDIDPASWSFQIFGDQ